MLSTGFYPKVTLFQSGKLKVIEPEEIEYF